MADLRADKFLADLGIGTRSQIKNIIKNKKVAVNGQIITSANVKINTEKDVVTVNGKKIDIKINKIFFIIIHLQTCLYIPFQQY